MTNSPTPNSIGKGVSTTKGNVWLFPEAVQVEDDLVKVALGSRVIAELLVRRGINTAQLAREFLDETSYTPTSPYELPGVQRAIERIGKAIEDGQQIVVYGDYDVDGVTGTSVLLTVLKRLGANVDFYIPNRVSEGYGLNLKAVSVLASKKKTKLIITCDCGVSNFAEINFAKSLGVDTVVLDHHTMPEVLPPAVAVVHPKLLAESHPLNNLPGVGVAYKVCEALLNERGLGAEVDALLDFVTMGMIADLVPLVSENRYLVKIGLEKLVKTPRVGLKALLGQVHRQTDTDLVGFGIAPRINAAGRLSDANKAVELLTTDDEDLAQQIADALQLENTRRQELCEQIFMEADQRVQRIQGFESQRCIAIYDENWHHGVVGIVASRLVEKYHRPVFIGQLDAEEGIVKGSARGVDQLDLYEVLKANEHMLIKWGGHKMAAGFSVEAARADELCTALVSTCNKMLNGKPIAGILKIDMVLEPKQVCLELARTLAVLAPFGMANKKPRFCMRALVCHSTKPLGKEGKHSRIMLVNPESGASDDSSVVPQFECVMWNSQGNTPAPDQEVDLVFTPEVNTFNNRDRLQLVLHDWRSRFDGQDLTSIEELLSLESNSQAPEVQAQDIAVKDSVVAAERDAVRAEGDQVSPTGEYERLQAVVDQVTIPTGNPISSVKQIWRDLRNQTRPQSVIDKGVERLRDGLAIYNESSDIGATGSARVWERTAVKNTEHLLIWQYPPSADVFASMLAEARPANVYLVGQVDDESDDPGYFLKRLYGLCRYAAREKDGQVETDRLVSLMACTKMTLALGLGLLKSAHLVDWFVEEGVVNLDLLEHSGAKMEELPEYIQLVKSLEEAREFRKWCATAPVKELQLTLVQNRVSLPRDGETDLESGIPAGRDEYDSADGQSSEGINATS